MKRVQLQEAYILHRRSYRETSFLVELFTKDHGRVSLVARGVRKSRSQSQGLLQPFLPVLVSWAGSGELMTLTQLEPHGEVKRLQKDCLFAGFYLNELLYCLLQKWDGHPKLFFLYEETLEALQVPILEEKILRSFEKNLLEELGYGLLPKENLAVQNAILPDQYYRFIAEQGFIPHEQIAAISTHGNIFKGKNLLAIANEDWNAESLHDAKRLTRFILTPLLGIRPLYSRKLFMQVKDSPLKDPVKEFEEL